MKYRYAPECPVEYPEGSWMGVHHMVFHEGTRVELGMDAEYRCVYCGMTPEEASQRIAALKAKGFSPWPNLEN